MLLDWPSDRVETVLKVCEWAADWSFILFAVDVGVHFNRVAVTVLDRLADGRKNTD
jgi:hypothetical protein